MLKIRMQRIGRKNMPAFRIIVAEHTRGPKTGNIVEKVGTYNPKTKERQFNADRIKYWLSVGAKASTTAHNMFVSAKIISGAKMEKHSEKPAKPAAPADLPAEASAQAGGGSASGGEVASAPAVEEAETEAKTAEGGSPLNVPSGEPKALADSSQSGESREKKEDAPAEAAKA